MQLYIDVVFVRVISYQSSIPKLCGLAHASCGKLHGILTIMYLSRAAQYLLLLLRLSMGWLFVYDGYSKFTSDSWSILPTISGSHILPHAYDALAVQPALGVLNQWYPIMLIIAGALILTGLWMRIGATLATALLVFAYLPLLQFPLVGTDYYIINPSIIYILLITALAWMNADQFWGLGAEVSINK